QDSAFVASVGQAFVRQSESRASQQRDSQVQQRGELLHAAPEQQDFLFEVRRVSVRHVRAYYRLRCVAEPPTGRRTRNAEIRCDGDVPRALHEIPKTVVVALLTASRGRHWTIIGRLSDAAQIVLENVNRSRPSDDAPE